MTLDRMGRFAIPILIAGLAACGCGGGSSNPVAPPGPSSISEVEPNDATPQSLGTLDATDKRLAGTASSKNDVDLFSVTLSAGGSIFMSLSWTGVANLEVGITDQNGIVIRNVDTASPEQCTVTGRAAGTYIVRVGSSSSSAVSYLLTVGKR